MSRGADHLRPGDGGTDRNSACAPRFEGEALQVGDGSVAPHVVSVELRALDADGGERQRHVPGFILPVHYDDRPPPGCALGHPDTRRAAAAHAPDTAAPQHAHSEHVFSAPVQGLGWQAIPAVGLRLTPAARGQLARLADFHAVHERLIRVRDLAELQVHVPRFALSGGVTREREPGPIPRKPRVLRMCPAGVVPALRHGDRLPGVLVEPTGAVAGIVARAEAPRPADRVDIIAGHDRGRRVASGGTRLDGAARHRSDRERALQQREAIGWQIRQVVAKQGKPSGNRHDGCPHLGGRPRQRSAHHKAVGVVQPGRAVIEAPQARGACR